MFPFMTIFVSHKEFSYYFRKTWFLYSQKSQRFCVNSLIYPSLFTHFFFFFPYSHPAYQIQRYQERKIERVKMNGKSQRERVFVFVAAGASSADSASRSKSTRLMYNQIQFPQLQKEREVEDDVNATGEYNQSFYTQKRNPTQQRETE